MLYTQVFKFWMSLINFFLNLSTFNQQVKDDNILIKAFQQQDANALSKLYDKYSGAIYGVIIRMCKDEVLAQEILQETFMKAWNKSHMYDASKGKFYTWLYRIARNTTLNSLRKEDKLIQTEDLAVYKDEETISESENYAELKGAIQKLEKHHQQALTLVYFNGLTHREAHEVMGVPLGTFKSYISQALKKLRAIYKKELLLLIYIMQMIS